MSMCHSNIVAIICGVLTPYMLNPTAWNWGSKAGFFWGSFCVVATIWTWFRLPEGKNRTYAELDVLFEKRVPARKFKNYKTTVQTQNEVAAGAVRSGSV